MGTGSYGYRPTVDEDLASRREALVLQHLPQVRLIAKRIHDRLPSYISLDDLISSGVVGLLAAIDNFDPTLNVQLLRPPASGWVGVRAATHWRPEVGAGFGAASLVDEFGVIGAVSMAVALTPFAAPAERREPA